MANRARILLLVSLFAGFPQPLFPQTGDQGGTFAKAYALYSSGNLAQAKELFQKTLEAKFRLADYSLYYLATIALSEANLDQARQLVAQLRQRFPQSIWLSAAALLRAKTDIAEKNYAGAVDRLRQLRADKSLKREIAEEALYLQAQALEAQGDPSRAHSLYNELRNTSPNSPWTAPARKAQARLREKFPELFPFHTIDSLAEEADRLTRERQSNEAEVLYKKLLNNVSEPELRLRYLTKLAALHLAARSRNEAILVLEQIARDFPDSTEAPKALYQIGQILWNRHDNIQALEYFKLLVEKYPTSADVDRARYASADIHEYFGRKEEAVKLYTTVQKQFSKSEVRDDAAWRLAWLYYRSGELQSAAASFRELIAQSSARPARP
jgi:TolA-binding protein